MPDEIAKVFLSVAIASEMRGGYSCQNCSRVEVEKQGEICTACRELIRKAPDPIIEWGRVIGGLDKRAEATVEAISPPDEAICATCGHTGFDHWAGLLCDRNACGCQEFIRRSTP